MQVGDRIRDIEDGDCYFEGIVTDNTLLNVKYIVDKVVWNGEILEDDDYIGKEISPKWWYCENISK